MEIEISENLKNEMIRLGVHELFLKNLKSYQTSPAGMQMKKVSELVHSFVWANTPEGDLFW